MADSKITKRALADALKDLMSDIPFEKITISDIADHCGMSRKSFYYHFQDKYDLVNWIFESEYIQPLRERMSLKEPHYFLDSVISEERWVLIHDLCQYFYDNKSFYSKVFRIKGQNCFSSHFRSLIMPLMYYQLQSIDLEPEFIEFSANFYMDAALSAFEHWIVERNSMPPEQFISMLRRCVGLLPNTIEKNQKQ